MQTDFRNLSPLDSTVNRQQQLRGSSLLSGRNKCWPLRMLTRGKYADGTETFRQTDGHQIITLCFR